MNLPSAEPASLKPATPSSETKAASGTSFADVHSASLRRLAAKGGGASPVAEPASARATAAAEPAPKAGGTSRTPKGETYLPVEGQQYEEIASGPRNGMFINRSGNSRDGEAFLLVKRSGREFHIYGSGADREVVRVQAGATPRAGGDPGVQAGAGAGAKTDAGKATDAKDRTSDRVTYADVPGRAFDEITSGRRNGMYVNRSGNSRDGEAFVLVERARHELHIYGSGKDRVVVRVVPPGKRDDAEAAEPVRADKPAPAAPTPAATATPGSGAVAG